MCSVLKIFLLNILITFLSYGCCKKSDPKPLTELEKLPPATQKGKDTFGCLVNGKAWVPKTTIDADAFYQLGVLQLGGGLFGPTQFIEMGLLEVNGFRIQEGTYPLIKTANSFSNAGIETSPNTLCSYSPSDTFSGTLTITKFDRVLYIVSGLFEFSTVASGCDTLKITNGRFDIRYTP